MQTKEVDMVTGHNNPPKIKVMLADDHPLMLNAIRRVLDSSDDFEVIGQAGDGSEAVELALKLKPDVLIMDISMPKINGIQATKMIKAKCPGIEVLVLTVYDDIEHVVGILEAGATGYLTKNASDKEIAQAVRSVATGESIFSPQVFREIFKHTLRYPIKPISSGSYGSLTTRELEVLKLIAKGMSNKEIAAALGVGLRTVKGHLVMIFSKLRVNSRTEAVSVGLRAAFLNHDDLL